MAVHAPVSVADALALLSEHPGALILAGGTDALVEINDGHRRFDSVAPTVIAVDRLADLRRWDLDRSSDRLRIGAGVTYTELTEEPLASFAPALAEASRTVGSPQIRNAGTLGGNLGTCSPAGDALPVLAALDAEVELISPTGTRTLSVHDFMLGPKRTALGTAEIITAVTIPVVDGWQGYAKVGVRNAMVIATASACLVVDRRARTVRIALGSVGPTVLRCHEAEQLLAEAVDWSAGTVEPAAVDAFARRVAGTSRPIDDHRSSAAYRRHAVGVLAARLVARALEVR